MASYLNTLLFGIYPYIALSVMVIGCIVRYDREPYTWRSGSSQLLRRRQLIWGSNLFHIGVLIVFFGHLIGLLTPITAFEAIGVGHGSKQLMAIVVGGIAGVVCIVGGAMLLHRRLADPRIRRTSSFGDIAILFLLLLQLLLGMLTIPISMGHLDGAQMLAFMAWAQGIFTFQPGVADLVADAHWVFKAHLFLGLTIFLVFPFTRLVHMLSVPIRYLWRPGYLVVRTRVAGRVNPLRRGAVPPAHPRQAAK